MNTVCLFVANIKVALGAISFLVVSSKNNRLNAEKVRYDLCHVIKTQTEKSALDFTVFSMLC